MSGAALLLSASRGEGALTLSTAAASFSFDPASTSIYPEPCNPARPLPRLLAVSLLEEVEEGSSQRHTFQIDRVSAGGRAALAALGLERLAVAEVEAMTHTGAGRLVLRYRVGAELVEWIIHGPVCHMVAGRTSGGLLWLRVFYLDTLDAPAGPTLGPPSADFLVTADQWQELMPVLAGL